MVIAGSPAEETALEDFRAELDRIIAGAPVAPAASSPAASSNDCAATAPAPPQSRRPAAVAYQPTIRQLPASERPRERLREHGPRYLNNAELVAILLGSGVEGENAVNLAQRIIAEFEGLAGLARAGYGELCRQHGVNHAKTSAIMAALELGRRIASLARRAGANFLPAGCRQSGFVGNVAAGAGKSGCPAIEHPQPGGGQTHYLHRHGEQQRGAPRRSAAPGHPRKCSVHHRRA